jgi:hypothetical protein
LCLNAAVRPVRRIAGFTSIPLDPMTGDFNEDLTLHGRQALLRHVRAQLAPEDAKRFCAPA